MKTWVITLIAILTLVTVGGCSSSAPEMSAALAPAVDTPDADARSTSALSWGSPVVVDDQPWAGHKEGTSQAIIDGNPAVSYIVWSKKGPTQYFTLYYSRANDAAGTSWGRAKKLASWYGPTSVGRTDEMFTSLCQVNGNPAVCYGDDAIPMNRTLRYVRASDSAGNRWGDPITVDGSRNIKYPIMTVVNGNPAIKYWDWNNAAFYVRAEDPNGETWGTPALVPGTMSFAIVNGHPAVCYAPGQQLTYLRATDANGDSWGTPVIVQPSRPDRRYIRGVLAVVGGHPAIAWSAHVPGYGGVYYIRALDEDGTSWPADAVNISDGTSEDYIDSLIDIDGLPAIAFHSSETSTQPSPLTLKFISGLDADGSAWETPVSLASLGTMWHNFPEAKLAAVGQRAGIAFMDTSHAMNFVGTLPAPPDPAVNVQLSTDKSAYIIGEDTQAVLTAVVTDEYGDPISGLGAGAFATTLNGGGLMVTFSESATAGTYTGNLDISGLTAGDYTVETTVTDTRDASGSDSASFTVSEPGVGGTMHVGDLDGSIDTGPGGRWRVIFTVLIEDSSENPVSGADVSFTLSGDLNGGGQVTTGGEGTASYQTGWIKGSGSVTFTVNDVTHATLNYSAGDNHDDESDSDGNSITVSGS